jgi:glycosyltransferase involved in cell wall biosynthesis
MKIAVLTVRASSGEVGGAERLFDSLVQAFNELGHQAEEVTLSTSEATYDDILANYLHFYDLNLSSYDVVVSTKAPTWMVRHPRHVCYLVHTIRAFYDMFESTFPSPSPTLLEQRKLLHALDTKALSRPACRAVFSIGHEVTRRLERWNGTSARVLHPPLWSNPFQAGSFEPYLFLPGRLHAWKRTDLVVRAVLASKSGLVLKLAGTGEAEESLRTLAGGDPRIQFLGRVSEETLVAEYRDALGVPFTPKSEDYGYVTLEAFASGKPVITCTDSGEAALIVNACGGGWVVEPTPTALAAAFDNIARSPGDAKLAGGRGFDWVTGLSWKTVASELLAAAT